MELIQELQNLLEALDSKVDYEVTRQTAYAFKARAKINGRWIKVNFDTDDQVTWNWEFREGDTKSTSALTGSGGQFQVLALMKDVLAEFIATYQPLHITFSAHADSKSRANVYERMLKKIDGYRLSRDNQENNTNFTLTRK